MRNFLLGALCFVGICSLSAVAVEQENTPQAKMLSDAFDAADCAALNESAQAMVMSGTGIENYSTSNAELHRCQYVLEIADLPCASTGNCASYLEWSKANPNISPLLSRKAFLTALREHEERLLPSTRYADN